MATKLKGVGVALVGFGLTGGIIAKELSGMGLSIVALERGVQRDTNPDFAVPQIRDELRFVVGASVFPHNSAYNPTGPVGALAYRTADIIKNRYLKRPGPLA